jgi:hypothetical protein
MKRLILGGLFSLVLSMSSVVMASVRVEGIPRACAGGVENDVHQFSLVLKGFLPRQKVVWEFEGVTRRNDKGTPIKVPHLFDRKWQEKIELYADAKGQMKLKVLSGQAVERPLLLGKSNGKVVAKIECDFDAPETLRRFPEPNTDNENEWRYDLEDTGYLFDDGLAVNGKSSTGKIYFKFRRNNALGDVDGNWKFANGHLIRMYIASVSFNQNVFRSDGAKVTVLTDPKETAPYAYIDPKTTVITTSHDGSASFIFRTGPKYNPRDDVPQITVGFEDLTTYIPKGTVPPSVKMVASQGRNVEWQNSANNLRGKMLLGVGIAEKRRWQIVKWGDQGRVANSKEVSKVIQGYGSGLSLWSPTGNRFRITSYGIINDYSTNIGIFKSTGQNEENIGPLYPTWGAFSPLGTRFARVDGSSEVVGSSRIGDDYSLRIWDGARENKLPIGSSFLFHDNGQAMVSWRDENELLVTQEASQRKYVSKPRLRIDSVRSDGNTKPSTWLTEAWKPIVSPDKNWVAFYGPESERQKPTQYWIANPLDQSLCIARYDKKPLRSRVKKYPERRPLDRFQATYPAVFWTPDSRFLITAQVQSGVEPFVRLQRFRVSDGHREVLANLNFDQPKHEKSNDIDSASWKFDGLSRDGKYLYLTFVQSRSDGSYMREIHQWFRFGIADRKLEKLAVFRDCDFSWHDES